MLTLVILALFSGEARALLHSGDSVTPLVLVIVFLTACFLVRKHLVDRAVYHPSVVIDGRRVPVSLQPAHQRVTDYVQARAEELGIAAEIDVFYVPGSWRAIDAYVFGSGVHQSLVVTGGLQALFMRRRANDVDRFAFVVDHELGHIAQQDTSLLYLARAALITVPFVVLIKALLIFVLGPARVLAAYMDMFPALTASTFGLSTELAPLPNRPSEWFVVGFFIAFTLGVVALVSSLYVAIVRRREFLADRFAVVHSAKPEDAPRVMEALLLGTPLAASPPHAFLGAIEWHPRGSARLTHITADPVGPLPERLSTFAVVLALISIRFILGATTQPREDGFPIEGMVPASAAFALWFGFVIDGLLASGGPRRERLDSGLRELGRALVWTVATSACLALLLNVTGGDSDSYARQFSSYRAVMDVELTERLLLIFSIPVAVLTYGLVFLLFHAANVGAGMSRSGWLLRVLAGSTVAVLVLWSASLGAAVPLRAYKIEKYTVYWTARVQTVQKGLTPQQQALVELLAKSDAPPATSPEAGESGSADVLDRNAAPDTTAQRLLPMELRIMRTRLAHDFAPPFAFLALWQTPLRASIL